LKIPLRAIQVHSASLITGVDDPNKIGSIFEKRSTWQGKNRQNQRRSSHHASIPNAELPDMAPRKGG
jgi:hypothetical protein